MTSEILESTQLAFEESQFHLVEVTMELERLQSLLDFVQSQTVVSGDPRMSMVEVERCSGDEDISVLDTSIGMLGSISCCLSSDVFSPSAVHGSYGYETVSGDLQSCVDCRSCTVCGFSILGTVSFGNVHHCCRVGLYILLRPVECVGSIKLV